MASSEHTRRRRQLEKEVRDADAEIARWTSVLASLSRKERGDQPGRVAQASLDAARAKRTRADLALNALDREERRNR
jgi:hypothetical protein